MIDYNWGSPARKRRHPFKWLYRLVFNTNAPLCHSNHYRPESFNDDQGKLF